jgi:hypothetical protein
MGNVTISATTANACGCCGAAPSEPCCTASYTYTGEDGVGSATGLALIANTSFVGGAPGLSIAWTFEVNIATPALLRFDFAWGGDGNTHTGSVELYNPNDDLVDVNSTDPETYADFICNVTGCHYGFINLNGSLVPGAISDFQTTTTVSSNAAIYCNTFSVSYGGP